MYAKTNRTDYAIAYIKKAIECDPRYVLAYYNLGYIYANLGNKTEAANWYKKALEFEPENPVFKDFLNRLSR